MKTKTVLSILMLFSISQFAQAQTAVSSEPVFKDNFKESPMHKGLMYRVSEPYVNFAKTDVNHLSSKKFMFDVELKNESVDFISAISINSKVLDKSGDLIDGGTMGLSIPLLEPKPVDYRVINPGYQGVYRSVIVLKEALAKNYGSLEFKISRIEVASKSLKDKPVYTQSPIEYKERAGLTISISDPYWFLNTETGLEYVSIALKVNNANSKSIKRIKVAYKIIGKTKMIQENELVLNSYFEPYVSSFAPAFGSNSERTNPRFFMSDDASLIDEIKNVEMTIIELE